MELTNATFAPLRVLVDELARCQVEHAVVCPGSRDAPLVYVLADQDGIATHSVLDERSAGFVALGLSKATGRPVVVVCTSGTAAANLMPAVTEASEAGVPLIVLTADRPPELRDVGAGQAIDQIKIFGDYVRWFNEAGALPLDEASLVHHRALGCRAVAEATAVRPGPVHINLPLREPLRPVTEDLTALAATDAARGDAARGDGAQGRTGRKPWTAATRTALGPAREVAAALAAAKRPLIVAGEHAIAGLNETIAANARRLGAPVFADALSGLRAQDFSSRATVVAAYEAILREPGCAGRCTPDFVLRIGATPTSKTLREWLGTLECEQIVIDAGGIWKDPTRRADAIVQADAAATLDLAGECQPAADPQWREHLAALEETAQAAIDSALAQEDFPTEPGVARALAAALPAATTVWVSSSMPVRDLEWFAAAPDAGIRYLSNRGANGIDGVLASACGAALAGHDPVVLLTGDLALLHDVGSLQLAGRLRAPLTVVCIDNNGGGIFEFLPVAQHPPHFEELIATPSGLDLAAIAASFGIGVCAPTNGEEFAQAVKRPGFVHLRTERAANRELHDRVWLHTARTLRELDSVGVLDD